jgi:hypothetical protein
VAVSVGVCDGCGVIVFAGVLVCVGVGVSVSVGVRVGVPEAVGGDGVVGTARQPLIPMKTKMIATISSLSGIRVIASVLSSDDVTLAV